MRRHITTGIIIAVAIIAAISAFYLHTDSSIGGEAKVVVCLHSFEKTGEEGEYFEQEMERKFKENGINAKVHHFYFDMIHSSARFFNDYIWKRNPLTKNEPVGQVITDLHPDIILVNDDQMMEWLMTIGHKDSLFHHTPVVFAGVTSVMRDSIRNIPMITGFEDHINLDKNLDILYRLTKGHQNPIIELDPYEEHYPDAELKRMFSKEFSACDKHIDNSDFRNTRLDSITYAKIYPGKVFVNFISFHNITHNRNRYDARPDAHIQNTEYLLRNAKSLRSLNVKCDIYSNTLIDKSSMPQFTCIHEQFNDPTRTRFIGGYFTTLEQQISDEVTYASRILKGEPILQLPIQHHRKQKVLDYNAFASFKPSLNYDDLKDEFEIINVPFETAHPVIYNLIIVTSGLIILSLIIYFARLIMRKNAARREAVFIRLNKERNMRSQLLGSESSTVLLIENNFITFPKNFSRANNIPLPVHVNEFGKRVHEETYEMYQRVINFQFPMGVTTVRLKLTFDKGDTWHWYELSFDSSPETRHERKIACLLICVDKIIENEYHLNIANEQVSEMKAKQIVIANISHDMRTPLNAITGFAEILTSPDTEMSAEESQEIKEMIHTNSDMLMNMIDRLVNSARAASDVMDMHIEPISVNELLRSSYSSNSVIAPDNITFMASPLKEDKKLNVDRHYTMEVINNFVSNAFKFTADGSVTIGANIVPQTNEVEIYCEDTGIGIAEESIPNVFDIYYKAKEHQTGTGLGLAISKNIVSQMNGTIGVNSKMGKGSRFWFRIKAICVTLLMLCTLSSCTYIQSKKTKGDYNIMVVHSYDESFRNYEEYDAEIRSALIKNGIHANIFDVYLGLNASGAIGAGADNVNHLATAVDSMRKNRFKPDIIISEGDRAFTALNDSANVGEAHFATYQKKIPIIFGALHYPKWDIIRNHKNYIAIQDPIDFAANIDLAQKLTGMNVVNIELDWDEQGDRILRSNLSKDIERSPYINNSDFRIMDLSDYTRKHVYANNIVVNVFSAKMPETNQPNQDINNLSHEDSILGRWNTHFMYLYGNKFICLNVKQDAYVSIFADKTGRPQFSAVKAGFANGDGRYLAGYFAGYKTIAEDVALIAAQKLKGVTGIETASRKHRKDYYMDYTAMQRLGLKYEDYNNRFIILNAPLKISHPQKYWMVYWILPIAIVLFVVLLIVYFIMSYLESEKVRELEELNQEHKLYELALHNIPNFERAQQLEEDVEKSQRLSADAQKKNDFLTNMSKEIRTPLNAIINGSDRLLEAETDLSAEEKDKISNSITKNSETLINTIEDLLLFSRIESGKKQYEMKVIDLESFIKGIEKQWKPKIPDHLNFFILPSRSNVSVYADTMALANILSQFLSNAVKFTESGNIVLGWICNLKNATVEIFVSDSGCGISEEKRSSVFTSFWKENEFITGIGLGLNVAKSQAEAMNGHISVQSRQGVGSKFGVNLPMILSKEKEQNS